MKKREKKVINLCAIECYEITLKRLSITIGEKELEWLQRKVQSEDFSSISHGIRKCVRKVMRENQNERGKRNIRSSQT